MTSVLAKIFIKNYKDVNDSKVRSDYGVLAGIVGILVNVLLCVLKMLAGVFTGAVSIIADAFNNLSDAGSSIVSLVGFKLSVKPADKDHPFGHGRVEYVCTLIVAIAVLLMGIELVKTSVEKIFRPGEIVFTAVSAIILIVSILFKLGLFFFNRSMAKMIESDTMRATAADSISDAFATLAVLIGMLFFKWTSVNIDAYVGILVSVFILYTGFTTIKEALTPLLGQATDKELVKEIEQIVLSHEFVLGIHDLIVHNYGVGRFIMSLHAEVSADVDILAAHDKIDLIEKQLCEKFGCQAVIHMDPIVTNDEVINDAREFVSQTVKSINPKLSIHDFRMVSGPTHTNLIFDLLIPYDIKSSDEDIVEAIKTIINEKNENYFAVINVDKDFNG